ncbi:MAG: protein kinase [Sandaracinus sp.]
MKPVSMAAVQPVGGEALESLPRRFGRYQLFDHIGRGGMAEIFLARADTGIAGASRLLVVKQIHAALSGDPKFAAMFAEEAKLCAGLRHANIVQIVDLGRAEDPSGASLLFMAMEYVEGLDLNQLLRRLSQKKTPLPAEFAIHVVREVLSALDFAHRAKDGAGKPLGIVHRDVSPSNVLMSLEGEVKLCDFGIARAFGQTGDESAAQASERAKVVGKSAYMSPEQARGEDLDGRADVFAAGILLWELCAGRRLYRGSEDEMLAQARRAEIPPLPDRGLPAQASLQALLDRALAPDREARTASAAAMRDELDAYAAEARMIASPIRFGSFLSDHFEMELLAGRREREQALGEGDAGSPASAAPERGSAVVAIPSAPRSPDALAIAEQETPVPARSTPAPAASAGPAASAPVAMPPAPISTPPAPVSTPPAPISTPPAPVSTPPTSATPGDDESSYTLPAVVGAAALLLVAVALAVYYFLW